MVKIKKTAGTFLLTFTIIIAVFSISYAPLSSNNRKQTDYQGRFDNVLNLSFTPDSNKDIATTIFSDKGAWHGYSTPDDPEYSGGFSGPLIMDLNGRWLSKNFSQLHLKDSKGIINLSSAKRIIHYYPGKIVQKYKHGTLIITQTLIFINNRTAAFKTEISTLIDQKQEIDIFLTGSLMPEIDSKIEVVENRIIVKINKRGRRVVQRTIPEFKNIKTSDSGRQYSTGIKKVKIYKNSPFSFITIQQHFLETDEKYLQKIDFERELVKNADRWNNYFSLYFSGETKYKHKERFNRLAAKAIITLISNWRSPAKDLLHGGTFPSISYQGFYGFWSWDSWKHAVAYSGFAPEIAKTNILSIFDYQDRYGMVSDCIFTDKKRNNRRNSKPPLAAWSVWKVYEATHDKIFLKKILPKLDRYHNWWYTYRDHDKDGLCEYGSTDGTRIAAAWESGMDNAVRFDNLKIVKNSKRAWSFAQESVDLNSYLYADKIYLALMHDLLNEGKKAEKLRLQAKELKSKILLKMFNKEKRYFFDISIDTEKQILIYGPEGWIPLWAKIATFKEAEPVKQIILNRNKFNTLIPFPTLAADDPKFTPEKGYWRGPVWLDQAYFGIKGLRNYGFNKEADLLTLKFLNNAEGLLSNVPIHENYHPITGKRLNAANFSWSAAHILMMLKME